MLDKHLRAKIGDFGCAQTSEPYVCNDMRGTPHYSSPQVLNFKKYTNKTDMWSFGCVVYEMLTLTCAYNEKRSVFRLLQLVVGPLPNMYLIKHERFRCVLYNTLCVREEDRCDAATLETKFATFDKTIDDDDESKYKLIRELRTGTYSSVVYLATHNRNLYELRVIESGYVERVHAEVALACVLAKSSRFVRFVEMYQHTSSFYMITEYCSVNLASVIRDKAIENVEFAPAQVLAWCRQLFEALSFMHTCAMPLVHRNLTPLDIKVIRGDQLKIAALGSAALVCAAEREVFDAHVDEYSAPEVSRGDVYTPGADVWSAACIVFQLLTLQTPFYAAAASDTDMSVCISKAIETIETHVFFARMLAKCWHLDAAQRMSASEAFINCGLYAFYEHVKEQHEFEDMVCANGSSFTLVRQIDDGGASVVAAHTPPHTKFILQQVINLSDDEATRRDLRTLRSLVHNPHVLAFIGMVYRDGSYFVQTECCGDGGDLRALIDAAHSPFAYDKLVSMLDNIMSGLAYLHAHALVHTRLSPRSIFVDVDETLRIGTCLNNSNDANIDVDYTAPELLRSSHQQLDTKVDIWSLGCIAYELLTLHKACRAQGPLIIAPHNMPHKYSLMSLNNLIWQKQVVFFRFCF